MKYKIISFLVFLMIFVSGFYLSKHKILWTDESFTQSMTIEPKNYKELLMLNFSEGNKAPIFYIIQKLITNAASYHFPAGWDGGMNSIVDLPSQMLLRIPSNFFMSLAFVAIFYFFSSRYSLWAGFYGLLIAITSFMPLVYWLEARPYSQWFCFTIIEFLILIHLLKNKKSGKEGIGPWVGLGIIQVILSLTSFASIFQITIVSFILLLTYPSYKKRILAVSLPILIACFYAALMPKKILGFILQTGWINLIFDNCAKEDFIFIGGFLIFYLCRRKWKWDVSAFSMSWVLALLSCFAYILYVKYNHVATGFGLSNRYYIYFAGINILMLILASLELFYATTKSSFGRLNVIIMLICFVLIKALNTYQHIFSIALFGYNPS